MKQWLLTRPWGKSLLAGIGGALCIGLLAAFTALGHLPLLIAPFGASCVLVFGVPASPFARPRNVIGGYLLSGLMGLLALCVFGAGGMALAFGVGLSILIMLITETTHPPAGAVPIVVIMTQPAWSFLIVPVLAGTLVIVACGFIYGHLTMRLTNRA